MGRLWGRMKKGIESCVEEHTNASNASNGFSFREIMEYPQHWVYFYSAITHGPSVYRSTYDLCNLRPFDFTTTIASHDCSASGSTNVAQLGVRQCGPASGSTTVSACTISTVHTAYSTYDQIVLRPFRGPEHVLLPHGREQEGGRSRTLPAKTSIGVPIKVLHEAEGHSVTCETNTGQLYRGKLTEAEDSMNCQMSNITVTYRDGRVAQLEQVYIRGSKIRFLILPDMLKNAPMLKSMKNKNQGSGAGRGKAAILKAQVATRGRGRGMGRGNIFQKRR
nr:uncharacterized protein LOC120363187 [Saimiri boliviensis boliviensis]